MGNQAKMTKILVYKLIDRPLLAEFTWTGKSIRDKTKMAFKDLANIIELLHATLSAIDINYSRSTFIDHLKNKTLKYAYEYVFYSFENFPLCIKYTCF